MTGAYENVKARLEILMGDFQFVRDQMDEKTEWDSVAEVVKNFGLIYEFGSRVVSGMTYVSVESAKAFGEFVTNAEKQAIVADYLLSKLPIPAWMTKIVRALILGIIDSAVAVLKGKEPDTQLQAKAKAIVEAERAGR